MTYSARQDDGSIDRVNNLALSKEIGERLRISLDQKRIEMPPNLVALVKQLRLSEVPFAAPR
jgi:hypothetical protein